MAFQKPTGHSSPAMATLGNSLGVTASRKRERGSSDDDWTVVGKSRKKKNLPTPPSSAPYSSSKKKTQENLRPWFVCTASEDFPTSYHVVRAVEDKFGLRFDAKPVPGGQFMVRPTDDESLRVLSTVREIDGRRLHIVQHEAIALSKAVICGFPQEYGLCLFSRVDAICTPVRLKSRRTGMETRQVSVFFKGEIPKYIDLGSWGRFAVRPFVAEPVRCYRCQRWGHHQKRCSLPTKCGVCSGAHDTKVCLEKHKAQQQTSACCPNCSGKHHAWNLGCPVRKAQVQQKKKRHQQHLQQEVRAEAPGPEKKAPPRPRKRRRRSRKPGAGSSELPPMPKEQQKPTMRKKIQLKGNVVSRDTEVVSATKPEFPIEKLRPLLKFLVEEVAEATKGTVPLYSHDADMMIESAMCLHGMGAFTSREPVDPVAASAVDVDLVLRRILDGEFNFNATHKQDTEVSDVDIYDISES